MSKEREPASGGPGRSPEGDWRGSRRAARRSRSLVGETQVCRGAAAAARGRHRDTFARTGGDRGNAVRLARAVSGRRRGYPFTGGAMIPALAAWPT